MSPYESFVSGIFIIHPEGIRNMINGVSWALIYYPDWDYYASRFTD